MVNRIVLNGLIRFTGSLSVGAALFLISNVAVGQCPFDPTITPDNVILCPNTQDVLTTQEYDSYQWYKDGNVLPGQTDQTLVVDAFNDSGSQFSVEATLDGCTEMSPQVLVDGWAFLPPTVMTTGAEPLYFTQNGPVYCTLDTVLLVLMLPYDINIQWTDHGVPIPGATDDTLVVQSFGQYSVSGAPSTCPDFVQDLGLWIWIGFVEPTQPDIVATGSELCASPEGESYQWYFNGAPIPGSDMPCIQAGLPGSYVVDVTYLTDCSIPSEPHLSTGMPKPQDAGARLAYPVPATDRITIAWGDGTAVQNWRLLDATGRTVLEGNVATRSPLVIDVSGLETGRYWLNADEGVIPVCVVR